MRHDYWFVTVIATVDGPGGPVTDVGAGVVCVLAFYYLYRHVRSSAVVFAFQVPPPSR